MSGAPAAGAAEERAAVPDAPLLPLGEAVPPYPVAQDAPTAKSADDKRPPPHQLPLAHVALGGVVLAVAAVLVRAWDLWLKSTHMHERLYPLKSGDGVQKIGCTRPQTLSDLACGVVPCLVFLCVSDLLIRQRMRQDSTRWFVLHVVANIVVSISAAPDMLACLANPLVDPIGPVSVLPVYMIPCLFVYHLIAFHVPKDEWVHHVLFGGGIGGAGLYFAPGPLQNALAFFICGLPGGIDYAMLAMVKEGYISSATEKVWNARINVWLRSPGLLMTAYAIYLCEQSIGVRIAHPWVMLMVVALAILNGQYYMQRVVANTSHKVNGRGAC